MNCKFLKYSLFWNRFFYTKVNRKLNIQCPKYAINLIIHIPKSYTTKTKYQNVKIIDFLEQRRSDSNAWCITIYIKIAMSVLNKKSLNKFDWIWPINIYIFILNASIEFRFLHIKSNETEENYIFLSGPKRDFQMLINVLFENINCLTLSSMCQWLSNLKIYFFNILFVLVFSTCDD